MTHRLVDLDEMMRLRAKREGQIKGVIESAAGMYRDLHEIAGQSLEEIDELDPDCRDESKHEGSAAPQTIE
jgi:hypothetical protein